MIAGWLRREAGSGRPTHPGGQMTTPDESAEQDVWFPHDEGQLSAEDTLEDRGLDDAPDEGIHRRSATGARRRSG